MIQYSLATTREERRNLYSVLFDYVLHQINETCSTAGLSEYTDDEIQPLAVRLALADAPEAFYISVKLGVEGIGEILRRSIAASLSGFSNSEHLNQVGLFLLEYLAIFLLVSDKELWFILFASHSSFFLTPFFLPTCSFWQI